MTTEVERFDNASKREREREKKWCKWRLFEGTKKKDRKISNSIDLFCILFRLQISIFLSLAAGKEKEEEAKDSLICLRKKQTH